MKRITKRRARYSFSVLMDGLTPIFLYSRGHYFSFYKWEVYPYIMPFVYPVGMIAQTSSAYLTLCVTIERYVAVCRPLKARAICTYGRARTCVLIVGTCAVAYNIPREIQDDRIIRSVDGSSSCASPISQL